MDFIRYCEELAANGKCPSRRQLDRRNKRRQRKSLEVMLGFEDQWVLDFEKELHPPKQPRSEFDTVYEVGKKLEIESHFCSKRSAFICTEFHFLYEIHTTNRLQ